MYKTGVFHAEVGTTLRKYQIRDGNTGLKVDKYLLVFNAKKAFCKSRPPFSK